MWSESEPRLQSLIRTDIRAFVTYWTNNRWDPIRTDPSQWGSDLMLWIQPPWSTVRTAMPAVVCACWCRVAVCAAQYLPCLSRLGSRWVRAPPAAAAGASWRPACSPPALSPWQILYKGKHWRLPPLQHGTYGWKSDADWPRQDAQHQVEHEEGADDDERNEVDPIPRGTQGVVGLGINKKTQRSSVVDAGYAISRAERLRSRYRGQPSIPPWWCTGKRWARQTGCCRTAWCRRWGRSRYRCTRNSSGTSSLRRQTPALTSPPSRFLKRQDMNVAIMEFFFSFAEVW